MASKVDYSSWFVCTIPYIISPTHTLTRYLLTLLLNKIFLFNCNLPILRFTPLLSLLSLPIVLTTLLSFHARQRPTNSPSIDAIVLANFPIAWFYAFLYYTEVPSLLFVISTIVAAQNHRHWLASFVCFSYIPSHSHHSFS